MWSNSHLTQSLPYVTQVNTPHLNPNQTGQYSTHLLWRDERLSWPRWLVTYCDSFHYQVTKCEIYLHSWLTWYVNQIWFQETTLMEQQCNMLSGQNWNDNIIKRHQWLYCKRKCMSNKQRIYSRKATFPITILWWADHFNSLSNTHLADTISNNTVQYAQTSQCNNTHTCPQLLTT